METLTVPVDKKLRDVPVLTVNHLRVLHSIEKGACLAELAVDERTCRFVEDLFRLGWVKMHVVRH